MNDKRKKEIEYRPDEGASSRGNNLGLLFLVVPIGCLIWAFRTGTVFPIDQVDFFIKSATYTGLSFVALWILTFYQTKRDRTLYAISAFLFMLWFIGGLAGVAKINTRWDDSVEKTYYMKALSVQKISGGTGKHKGSPSCLVNIEKKILNVDVMWVKYDECDLIRPNIDGLMITVKDGMLGMPWMADHSIVKDYDLYKSRLGITD